MPGIHGGPLWAEFRAETYALTIGRRIGWRGERGTFPDDLLPAQRYIVTLE